MLRAPLTQPCWLKITCRYVTKPMSWAVNMATAGLCSLSHSVCQGAPYCFCVRWARVPSPRYTGTDCVWGVVLCPCAVLCCTCVVHQVNLLTQNGVTWIKGELGTILKQNLDITACFHGYVTWCVAFREMRRFRTGRWTKFWDSGREK